MTLGSNRLIKIGLLGATVTNQSKIEYRTIVMKKWSQNETKVQYYTGANGPLSIESMFEEYAGAIKMAGLLKQAEADQCDALIITCAGDPGIDELRNATSIPIIGTGQAGMTAAALLSNRFSLITVDDGMIYTGYEMAKKLGVLRKLASVRALNMAVLDISASHQDVIQKLIKICRKCIDEDGAQAIVLGCASMAFLQVTDKLQDELGVPVINLSQLALKLAEVVGSRKL